MKTRTAFLVFLCALLAGCVGTPSDRIQKNEVAFSTWPPDVQAKVRAGQVEVDFTADMVRVALGAPERMVMRTTQEGTSEVWIYADTRPRISFGVGVGVGGRGSAYGGGVMVGDDGFRDRERMRVIITNGRVSAIELRR